ncbi:uncharacterized protein LOC8068294 [Sorghum bicolor]|uniref:Uncharacterized protein n=1 Tax=Sorghum bicolor TaxID=4558 RepID=C5Y6F5_SORBI|nr:uncharacterized protein LOC8068294 [Sorghum bicolor]EES08851.1 hypothetical protein SORBI_3005G188300 [Sorghum bicolor]OQU83846.1 hypothetical protein SORBI_3005G188300 [Sorghum bicolor]|eukprot:XP_002449863.1 uncharacterized protein LOC8068294 [Sorghum bicolor]
MSFAGSADGSAEDYSAEATLVRFDPPLPLLRAPVRSPAPSGEGPVLAFRDAASWRAAWEAAEANLVSQCEAGARSGCSISASRKCKPPWWKGLFVAAPTDYEERERCEEREMAACLEAAKEACIKFAKAKCIGPFRDARIASEGLVENTDFHVWGAAADKSSSTSACALNNQQSFSPDPGATNYRGSDVLDSLSSKENNSSG